jgi:hypothetical protein
VESGRYTKSTSASQAFQSVLPRFFTADCRNGLGDKAVPDSRDRGIRVERCTEHTAALPGQWGSGGLDLGADDAYRVRPQSRLLPGLDVPQLVQLVGITEFRGREFLGQFT